MSSAMLHVRIDEKIKEQATETLAAMGLSMSEAVRLFLHRVIAEQAFPFELKVPNAETQAAMNESRLMMANRQGRFATPEVLFDDLEKNSNG
jgi:DNA-damage-inducible protein J